jgi:hypothetical protein
MMQDTSDVANSIHNMTPESSPPLSVSPCNPTLIVPTAPAPASAALANGNATDRQPRSQVWLHFTKADDYAASRKATCMHCGKTFKATHGSTTTMHLHLTKKHRDILTTPDGVMSLDR